MKILTHAFLVLIFIVTGTASAQDSALMVNAPYAYATTSVQKNGAAFMQIQNNSDTDSKITAASSSVAGNIELHTHIMDGDMMMMREVEAYDIPAGETTTLEPMGHHIMLMGLKAPLKAGETFPLVLSTQDHDEIHVNVMIKNTGDAP